MSNKRSWVFTNIFGLVLLVGGGWLLVYELQHPPTHSPHIYLFTAIAIIGALLITPEPTAQSPVLSAMKNMIVVFLPVIPWSKAEKARRSGSMPKVDPPDAGPG